MIGLDTNVLVRYVTHDHPEQTATAIEVMKSLTAETPGFLSMVVLAELVWVVETCYGFSKAEVVETLEGLLRSKELVVERADIALQAVSKFKTTRSDFSDCLIERSGHAAGCRHTITFDRRASSLEGMKLLQ